ncbi:MAG: fumarylacetoacetase [Candidatus Aldehydirespiratoraceae bacterium]
MTPPFSQSWVTVPEGSPFALHNLPFGVGRRPDGVLTACVAIGDDVLDVDAARSHFSGTAASGGLLDGAGSLNGFAALGRNAHREVRDRAAELLSDTSMERELRTALVRIDDMAMLLPVVVGDYVDFYSSLHHATNLGRLFRPNGEPLLPNWRQLPVGYHGRAGTIVASGTDVSRPAGLRLVDGVTVDGPTDALDFELEVGFVCGAGSAIGQRVTTAEAEEHLFGLCLVNDWSARDIQALEYQPLGPFLGKSFATSMSSWIVTLDALDPFRVEPPVQEPAVSDYLRTEGATGFDLHLEVLLQTAEMESQGLEAAVISSTDFADMYWTAPQHVAHMSANGAHLRPGDLFASGTVSGPTPGSEGSLIELTRRGEEPVALPDGNTRGFLVDGDTVIMRGWAGADPSTRIGLGSVTGKITPHHHHHHDTSSKWKD